ncbi:fatty acyl-CoA reductase wat-like [Macrosteles quadrilineatus]|uniref:fatty acyl-CoA reductase wat-like n=1 Tax=Macrosteles quadrilineatus TaxID=74068 RepID=UPI0023E0FEF8|nr:fatty acyl-CoA reductase wat-like [Macrosteles quadrilineatus]XP_054282499.1 fatty acyl-CoA reductase wat-like [Macrosteles quadrilineatus]
MVAEEMKLRNAEIPYNLRDPLEILGERDFQPAKQIPEDVKGSDIQEFFRGARVFITGGTGFLGKVVLEKLLRSIPHIDHVYLLIRPKKGQQVNDRLNAIFEDRVYRRLKTEVPWYRSKVSALEGDVSLLGLGLSPRDRQLVIDSVNVVIHGAATVRFNEPIKTATTINVQGTREILALAREIKNLKSMVHVSTAFANCNHLHIEERFYDMPTSYEDLSQLLKTKDEAELEALTPSLLADWPNTYTFTKAMAEQVVNKEGRGLPITVFRPAVVISSYKEPVRGWIDNVYGPTGLMVGLGTGVIHTYFGDETHVTDIVPVDLVTNALLASAWRAGTRIEGDIPIYNYVSSSQNPISWKTFHVLAHKYGPNWPTVHAIWYYFFMSFENPYAFMIANFLFHTCFGYIMDGLAIITGRKPMLTKIYRKLDKFADTMTYFANRIWTFKNDNTQKLWRTLSEKDKELFFFDIGKMSWEYHAQALCLGLRVYLLKDDIDTLPRARRKWNRLYWLHLAVTTFLSLVTLKLFVTFLRYLPL